METLAGRIFLFVMFVLAVSAVAAPLACIIASSYMSRHESDYHDD